MNHQHLHLEAAKIGQNLMWSQPLSEIDNEDYQIPREKRVSRQDIENEKVVEDRIKGGEEEAIDLEDIWNSVEEPVQIKQRYNKVQIMNIEN